MGWVPEWTRFRPPRGNRHHQFFQDPKSSWSLSVSDDVFVVMVVVRLGLRGSFSFHCIRLRMAVTMRVTTINMVLQLCSVSKHLFHKRVRLVKSVQSINHLVCLEFPRWCAEMQMLRLVMGQLGLSLDDKNHSIWAEEAL